MKDRFEIRCDYDVLTFNRTSIVRKAHEQCQTIVWNHKGMRGVIPPAVLDHQFAVLDAWALRRRPLDAIPTGVGRVPWEQVVEVPTNAGVRVENDESN